MKNVIILAGCFAAAHSSSVAFAQVTSTFRATPLFDATITTGTISAKLSTGSKCVFDQPSGGFHDFGNPEGHLLAGAGRVFMDQNLHKPDKYFPCRRPLIVWDITDIPSNATITDTRFEFTTINSAPRRCDFVPLTAEIPLSEAEAIAMDALRDTTEGEKKRRELLGAIGEAMDDATPYLERDESCYNKVGRHKLDLGGAADIDIKKSLSNGWFAMGIKAEEQRRRTNVQIVSRLGVDNEGNKAPPTLVVTYTVPGPNTGGDNTGGDNTGGDNTGGDNTGGDNTGGDNTGGDNTGGNTGGDNTGGDNTGGDKTDDNDTSNTTTPDKESSGTDDGTGLDDGPKGDGCNKENQIGRGNSVFLLVTCLLVAAFLRRRRSVA